MKKYLKTALSLMLTLAMTACMVLVPVSQTAFAATVKAKSVSLNHKVYTIKKGKTVTLKATVSPKNATQKTIVWTSSNKKIATVKNGKVKGLKKGKVTITAKVKGTKKTAKATIYVGTPVSSVKVSHTSIALSIGDTVSAGAKVSPSTASVKTITYSSSNKKVATVNSKGVITAIGEGTAVITAAPKDEAGKKAKINVLVSDPGDMKVVLITDGGGVDDQSYNQVCFEAIRDYCGPNGITYGFKRPADFDTASIEAKIKQAINEHCNVIVLPGFVFADAIYDLAPKYPDVKFVAVDMNENDITAFGERTFSADNVAGIAFKEEMAGYMAGYAAVKLGYKKLGFLGALPFDAVQHYGYGFVQGADAAAAEIAAEGVEVKFGYAGSFMGDERITNQVKGWYESGTECVFACGGALFTSVAEAAASSGGKMIGVDVDQSATVDGAYGNGITVTSAAKDLNKAVGDALDKICNDKWDECKGFLRSGEGCLPDSTQWSDGFTKEDYEQLRSEILSGARTVSDDVSAMPAVTNILVIEEG